MFDEFFVISYCFIRCQVIYLMSFCKVSDSFSAVSDEFLMIYLRLIFWVSDEFLWFLMSFWWVVHELLMSFWVFDEFLGTSYCFIMWSGYIFEIMMRFCWVSGEFSGFWWVSDEFLMIYLRCWVSDEFLMSFCDFWWVAGVQIQHRFNKLSTKYQQKSPKLNRKEITTGHVVITT